MADAADIAGDILDRALERGLAVASAPLAPGVAGDYDECGRQSPRLVGRRCAPCRDGHPR